MGVVEKGSGGDNVTSKSTMGKVGSGGEIRVAGGGVAGGGVTRMVINRFRQKTINLNEI